MQKAQSDLKRSEEQIRLKDQEIYKMKRKVRHIYFILSRLSSRFSSSTAIEISNSLQIKDWEIKNKNQESLRKKEQQQQRVQADQSEYLYRRCLMLEQRIFEMEVNYNKRLIIIQKELENLRIAGKISKIRKTFLKEKVWFISHNHSKFYIRISQKFLADYGLIWVGNSTNSPKYPETILK